MNGFYSGFALDSLVCWHLTLTLLHVGWIGLVIGCVAAVGNRVLQNRSANVRYWFSNIALLALAVSLPLTFAVVRSMVIDDDNAVTLSVLVQQDAVVSPIAPADGLAFAPVQPAADFQSDRSDGSVGSVQLVGSDKSVGSDRTADSSSAVWAQCQHIAKTAAPFVAALYFIGVGLMLIKLAIGVHVSRRLRATSQPITDGNLLHRLTTQAKKLSLRFVPAIAYCEHVAVPIVIGLLRPMILIPAAMVNGLTSEQLESVLTHELAHLRRYDHLLIVLQRVLEAVLFFHPVTWYLSRRIHDERETCCDDLVLAIGGDRLHYAQSLLRVAELRLAASRNGKSLTALAADGQRPSKLRQRIARLLSDSDSERVRSQPTWLVLLIVAFAIGTSVVLNSTFRPASAANVFIDETDVSTKEEIATESENRKLLDEIITKSLTAKRSIQSIHFSYRQMTSPSPVKPGVTSSDCQGLIDEFLLHEGERDFDGFLNAVVPEDSVANGRDWLEIDFHSKGEARRRVSYYKENPPNILITNGALSMRWSDSQSQLDIKAIPKQDHQDQTLSDFLECFVGVSSDVKIVQQNGILRVEQPGYSLSPEIQKMLLEESVESIVTAEWHPVANGVKTVWELNQQHGFPERTQLFAADGSLITETRWMDWRESAAHQWFPRTVMSFLYTGNQLNQSQFFVVHGVEFNTPISDSIFQMNAPAGATIVDHRGSGGNGPNAFRINRDVFDITSDQQLQVAQFPLTDELTADEVSGVAEASRLYALAEGEVLKRIGPPFPLARKYVHRMLNERQLYRRGEVSRMMEWDGTSFQRPSAFEGAAYSAGQLASKFTHVRSVELDGDEDLIRLRLPGDFVQREGATEAELLLALQNLISSEIADPVKIQFRDVEHTVYRATGTLSLNLSQDDPGILIDGGLPRSQYIEARRHGNLDALIETLSAYVNSRIVNEIEGSDRQLHWTERHPVAGTKKDDQRLVINPKNVLQQITDQTGIQFTEEKQKVRVLFIERANGQGAAAGAAKAPNQANAAATEPAEAATTDVKPLIANIDMDHSLELVAVVSIDDRTKAWTPDGTQIEPQQAWPEPIRVRSQEHPTHGFIFRCTGWKDETAVAWRAPGPSVTPSLSYSVPESIGLTGTFKDLKTINVRAGFTTPNWGPWVSIGFDDVVVPYETSPEFSELYARIKPDAYQNANQYGLVLNGINGVDERTQHEVVAVFKDGTRQDRSGTGLTKDIDLIQFFQGNPGQIDHLEYRLRPYVHWVTFENVSLAPGVSSEPKVAIQTLELPKKPAQKLHGHVRDAEGKPIADANVAVRTTSVGTRIVVQTKTDANGRFELALSGDPWPKGQSLGLWAWAKGFALNVENHIASMDDHATPVNMTLTVPRKVRFRVTDPSGNGVAGATVTPTSIPTRFGSTSTLLMPTESTDSLTEFLHRTTDADGNVELDSFQGRQFSSLTVQSKDYGNQYFIIDRVETILLHPERLRSLTLQPATRIRGRLVGAPVEFLNGIHINLQTDIHNRIRRSSAKTGSATAVTDNEGRFEIAAIASGELSITQRAGSDAEWQLFPSKRTLIAGTQPGFEFALQKTIQMPFKIVREDSGLPVAGVAVSITDESRRHVASCTSDQRGEFKARLFEGQWHFVNVIRVPAQIIPPTDEGDFAWFDVEPLKFRAPEIQAPVGFPPAKVYPSHPTACLIISADV